MSKIVAAAAIRGANRIVKEAEEFLNKAIKEKGESAKVEFPETAFYLPMAYALLGLEVKTVADIKPVLTEAKSLLHQEPSEKLWLPYLGDALDSGVSTLLAEEIIVALRYLYGQEPQPDCNGFFSDTILRTLGIQLVDGRMPGFAAILGAAPDNKTAVNIVRELQKRSIMIFVGSNTNGRSIIDQLKEEKVEMGWETYIVPYGRDTYTGIYPLNWAIRGALTFGGHKKGEALKCLKYCKDRVFAFGLALGEVDDIKYATGAGAINMGFPVIADTDIPEIRPTGICTYEHLVKEKDYKKIVQVAIEVRGVKVKVSEIPIPVAYSPAFEGERVRREQMYAQFGGKYSTAFEYTVQRDLDKIEDSKIQVIGPEIDQIKEGEAAPLGIIVEVAGRKMQKDFEPILERQIHTFLNEAMGIFHMGQRDMCWLRISKEAKQKGFMLKHFGVILHARMHEVFGAIVDKCQVTIFTTQADVEKHIVEAKKSYEARDERVAGMTDESVDTFFQCTLCQSFAPTHVCIVKPERLGLCGAYNWLDTKASYELNPTGPNQPIKKGEVLDPVRGEWKGVNEAVYRLSNKTLERFHGYSIMSYPETSCCVGDTEVIIDDKVQQMDKFISKHQGSDEYAKSKCLTMSRGKASWEPIVAMQKFPAPKELFKIQTKSGTELTLTANHEIAVDRRCGLQWVRADELQVGDRALSLKKLDIPPKDIDLRDFLPDEFKICDEYLNDELTKKIVLKYGTLKEAYKTLGLKLPAPRTKGISVGGAKLICKDLGFDWDIFKQRIKKVRRVATEMEIPEVSVDMFYLMGLIVSDGSISNWGGYQYWIDFVNTEKELISVFGKIYKEIFPSQKISLKLKAKGNPKIRGRKISSTKPCYQLHTINPLWGHILQHFGLKVGSKGKLDLAGLITLPEEYIVAFIAGDFDGDGSVRLRKYANKWDVAEAYLCIQDGRAASHLRLLLKRLGIIANKRKAGSVYKLELHGSNLIRFAQIIPSRHPKKKSVLADILNHAKRDKLDKAQYQVLPFEIGKKLVEFPQAKEVLPPSTYFYYKTGRSRPVAQNVESVLGRLNQRQAEDFRRLIDNDYFLDKISYIRKHKAKTKFSHVYNLTLAENHTYFANEMLIKNCGCFECIIAILPEVNGFMVVNREYSGMTPAGMKFTTLAGSVGGGNQTPGFMGVGRLYMVSKKFLLADGGLKRVVWMTKELKEVLGDKLKNRCSEIGDPDFISKIADETNATTMDELAPYLEKVAHPALKMSPLT